MESITLKPHRLKGSVRVPTSKSLCHRAVICAGLAQGVSTLHHVSFSEDIRATVKGMSGFGASVLENGETLTVTGAKPKVPDGVMDCGESGSTLRFFIPIGLLSEGEVTYTGRGKLGERPLEVYFKLFRERNIAYHRGEGGFPLTISGKLPAGTYELPGDVSSQFISGLLFALPLLEGDSEILLAKDRKVESVDYIRLTTETQKSFGVQVESPDEHTFYIPGNQCYQPTDYTVEGDYSQAAFWLVAGLIGDAITVEGIKENSAQGDRRIIEILESMGGRFERKGDSVTALPSELHGEVIDASQVPDLVPILSVAASFAKGTTVIKNAERLRIKESDRLAAMASELSKLGAKITETRDGLEIVGVDSLNGAKVGSWNDHRIAMSLAVAAIRAKGPVSIEDCGCVAKSYPNFWEHYQALGGVEEGIS